MIKIILMSGLTIDVETLEHNELEYYECYGCTLTYNGIKLNDELIVGMTIPLIEIAKFVKIPS